MRQALAASLACASMAMAFARSAHAGGPGFALDYEAPPACPAEASFVADVRARIADPAPNASDGRHFRVRITEGGGTYHGALETLDPPSVREVGGTTCEEVVRALVVFVALALSPTSPEAAPVDRPAPRDPPPAEPAEKKEPTVEPPRPSAVPVVPATKAPPRPPFLGADIRAFAATGVAPGLAPGGALGARLVLQGRPPSLRWIVHAGGIAAYREESVLAGAFTFLWAAGRIDAGPALELGPVRVSAGPVVRAGLLSVEARNLPSAGRYSSFWGDVGGFARVDRVLSSSIAASIMVELAAPIQRRTFGIQGIDEPVHEIAPLVGIASLGLTFGQ